jgi:hypothetical protein
MAPAEDAEVAPAIADLFDREFGRLEGELEVVRAELHQLEAEMNRTLSVLERERFEEYR